MQQIPLEITYEVTQPPAPPYPQTLPYPTPYRTPHPTVPHTLPYPNPYRTPIPTVPQTPNKPYRTPNKPYRTPNKPYRTPNPTVPQSLPYPQALTPNPHGPTLTLYQDVKYSFKVSPRGPDTMLLTMGEQEIVVKILQQADGSLFVSYGKESHRVFAREEPLGLRMVLDGVTVLLPTVYDPSELRSDITGKLVRYLVEDGAQVEAGTPFAEAEAMKMLITIKATEAGTISHEKQPGSIINQGDLLSSLTLKDPSKVKKILAFDGELSYEASVASSETTLQAYRSSLKNPDPNPNQAYRSSLKNPNPNPDPTPNQAYRSSLKSLELVMDGYVVEDADALVQKMLASLQSIDLLLAEVNDAASALGQKLPAELDASLQALYAKTKAAHVDGEDSAEAVVLVAALKTTVADYIEGMFESKKEGMVVTLAPLTAITETYANGLRDHAVTAVCALFRRYITVEADFLSQPSTDQANPTLTLTLLLTLALTLALTLPLPPTPHPSPLTRNP